MAPAATGGRGKPLRMPLAWPVLLLLLLFLLLLNLLLSQLPAPAGPRSLGVGSVADCFHQCLHQPVDGVSPGLGGHGQTRRPGRGRGDRTDGDHHRRKAPLPQQVDGPLHSRRGGEGHDIGPCRRRRPLRVGGHRPRCGRRPPRRPPSPWPASRRPWSPAPSRPAGTAPSPGPPGPGGSAVGKATARASDTERWGSRSTDRPVSSMARLVPAPTAAHRTAAGRARAPRAVASRVTALGDVHATHWYPPETRRSAAPARARPPSTGSSTAMTGSSTTSAPSPRNRATSADAWARVRVTTTLRPDRGSAVNWAGPLPWRPGPARPRWRPVRRRGPGRRPVRPR